MAKEKIVKDEKVYANPLTDEELMNINAEVDALPEHPTITKNKLICCLKQTLLEKKNGLVYHARQHGKAGVQKECRAEEIVREYNNVMSRAYKQRKRKLEASEDQTFAEANGTNLRVLPADTSNLTQYQLDRIPDVDGITPLDERRYKGCFKSYYTGYPIEREYIMRMTGLSLKQLWIMQERCKSFVSDLETEQAKVRKYIPYPAISQSEADADYKRRWASGDIY